MTEIDVETLARELHESGREAVESGQTVAAQKFGDESRRFLEWHEISEQAHEGRRVQARYLIKHFTISCRVSESTDSGASPEPSDDTTEKLDGINIRGNQEMAFVTSLFGRVEKEKQAIYLNGIICGMERAFKIYCHYDKITDDPVEFPPKCNCPDCRKKREEQPESAQA